MSIKERFSDSGGRPPSTMTPSLKPTYCKIHQRTLEQKRVKIVYGLIAGTPKCSPDYLRARETQFPHTDDFAFGGCTIRPQKYRPRMTCPHCIEVRNEWLWENCPTWAESHELDTV